MESGIWHISISIWHDSMGTSEIFWQCHKKPQTTPNKRKAFDLVCQQEICYRFNHIHQEENRGKDRNWFVHAPWWVVPWKSRWDIFDFSEARRKSLSLCMRASVIRKRPIRCKTFLATFLLRIQYILGKGVAL